MKRILLFNVLVIILHHGSLVASPTNVIKSDTNGNDLDSLENKLTKRDLEKREDSLSGENLDRSSNIGHVITKRATRIRYFRRPEVAFQATLTTPSLTVKMLDTFIFNNVITNIGNSYNKHTGVFTAPISGTYTFNTNIVAEIGNYVEASIVRNDKVTVSAISDHRIPQDGNQFTTWDQGNAVAILRLRKGDKVAVSLQWPHGSHAIHGIGKSSFSGYLLKAHGRF